MPRYVNRVLRPKSYDERLASARRYFRYARDWVDPYPTVMGTRPEKMVYAQLMLRGINFYFQSSLRVNLPLLRISKDYRPDFILPDLKIIIEVQGVYWHTKPGSAESDAYKQALYNMMGYKVLTWWDYEIEQNVVSLFIQEPKLAHLMGKGGRIKTARDKQIDDLKGLRTQNQARFRAKTPRYKRTRTYKYRKASSSYGISR